MNIRPTRSTAWGGAARRGLRHACMATFAAGFVPTALFAQTAFTWQQIKAKFATTNPTLQAAQANIDESRAAEITAFLRPNPQFTLSVDGFQVSRNQGVWRPLSGIVETPSISYLHERQHKRELRLAGAKISTSIAASTYL